MIPEDALLVPENDATGFQRAYSEVGFVLGGKTTEEIAIELDQLCRVNSLQARKHIYTLGPMLFLIREQRLYSYLGFPTMKAWLRQNELDISESVASDIINWWRHGRDACIRAGLDPQTILEDVSPTKLRALVAPIRQGVISGKPLADEEIRDLITMAQTMSSQDIYRATHPPSRHEHPGDNPLYQGHQPEPDPEIVFHVRMVGGKYKVAGSFNEAEMAVIDRRLRPTWYGPDGEILHMEKPQ